MGVLSAGPRASTVIRRQRAWVTCLVAVALSGLWGGRAATQTASGAEVKAAFLLNFSKFIEWPARPAGADFVIGVLGDDAVADALRGIGAGKSAASRPLVVRRVAIRDDLASLQMLFVGVSEESRLVEIIRRTGGGSVLTVSDMDRFCQQGGIIQFRSERDRVRFEINLDQATFAKLAINSKLLALAKTVYQSTKAPGVSQ